MTNQVLLTRFRLDNSQAITQARAFEAAIRKQNTAMQSTAVATTNMARSARGMGSGMRTMQRFMQQASFQAADFAIVMQQGQGFLRAFAVQGGQLLGFLPGMAAVIGGVVTVVGLLGQAWLDASGSGATFEDRMKSIDEAVSNYLKTQERVQAGTIPLQEDFGKAGAGPLIDMANLRAVIEYGDAVRQVNEAISIMADTTRDAIGTTEIMAERQRTLAEAEMTLGLLRQDQARYIEATGKANEELYERTRRLERQIEGVTRIMHEQADALGLTTEQYQGLNDAIRNFEQAEGPKAQLQAIAAFSNFIKESGINVNELEGDLKTSVLTMMDLGEQAGLLVGATEDVKQNVSFLPDSMRIAAGWAQNFAEYMGQAASAALQARLNALEAQRASTLKAEDQLAADTAYLDTLAETGSKSAAEIAKLNTEFDQQIENFLAASEGSDLYNRKTIEQIELQREAALASQQVREQTQLQNEALREQAKAGGAAAKAAKDAAKEQEKLQKKIQSEIDASTITWRDLAETGIGMFVDAIAQADFSFSEFAKNFLRQIAQMILQQTLLNLLTMAFGGAAGGAVVPGVSPTALQNPVVPFAKGGVVNSPTHFAMAGGNSLGVAGEAGAEAIMPLKRDSQGNLGVGAPSITINNMAGADVSVTRADDEIVEIAVNRARQAVQTDFSRSMQTGSGEYSRSMEQGYTARRRVT